MNSPKILLNSPKVLLNSQKINKAQFGSHPELLSAKSIPSAKNMIKMVTPRHLVPSSSKRVVINTSTKEKQQILSEVQIDRLCHAKAKDCGRELDSNQREIIRTFVQRHSFNFKLNLQNLSLGSESAKMISHFIRYDVRVTKLNLSCNKIKDEGANSIAQLLRNNKTLVHLDVSSN